MLVFVNSLPLNVLDTFSPLWLLHESYQTAFYNRQNRKGSFLMSYKLLYVLLIALMFCFWLSGKQTQLTSELYRGLGTIKIPLFQVLENCSSELKVVDGMEGMELSAAEQQGQDITMCSPEKDMCTGFSFTQSEEPKTHQMGTYLQAAVVCGIAQFLCLLYTPYSLNIILWNHYYCSFVSLCILVAKPTFVSMTSMLSTWANSSHHFSM